MNKIRLNCINICMLCGSEYTGAPIMSLLVMFFLYECLNEFNVKIPHAYLHHCCNPASTYMHFFLL